MKFYLGGVAYNYDYGKYFRKETAKEGWVEVDEVHYNNALSAYKTTEEARRSVQVNLTMPFFDVQRLKSIAKDIEEVTYLDLIRVAISEKYNL